MGVIAIRNLAKTYRGKKGRRVVALEDFSLEIGAGEVLGFLGPNGAGKSTTLRIVMGLLRPTSGSVEIFGVDSRKVEARRRVGYLPENPALYDFLSAEEYLRFVGRIHGMSAAHLASAIARVLERVDLAEARKRPVRTYSKGMVQRLGLAQALLHDPDLYILDEPMSGLDPLGRALVKEIILELRRQGKSVFFSTHVTSDVEQVCDRVAMLSRGRLQAVERVSDILTRGVEAYAVQIESAAGEVSEQRVAASELARFLAEVECAGGRVVILEPVRRHVEEFFLDLVRAEARPAEADIGRDAGRPS